MSASVKETQQVFYKAAERLIKRVRFAGNPKQKKCLEKFTRFLLEQFAVVRRAYARTFGVFLDQDAATWAFLRYSGPFDVSDNR